MNELELLKHHIEPYIKPYIEQVSATLGKHVGKRLLKVITHFGTGIAKYPQHMIERKDSEAAAKSENRIDMMQTATQHFKDNPELYPELLRQVFIQGLGWTVEEVNNVNDIVMGTTESLLNTLPEEDVYADQSTEDISTDWLNEFRSVACKKGSEEAQALFSKVLEGKIRKPGSFSLKALTTLADMDQNVALYFKAFCSFCLVKLDDPNIYLNTQSKSHFNIKDARIPYFMGSMEDMTTFRTLNHLNDDDVSRFVDRSKLIYNMFGLRVNEFQLLSEYGLIENASRAEYRSFWYNNELWGFQPQDVSKDYQCMPIRGYALTSVGRELFRIIKLNPPPQYTEAITKYLQEFYAVKFYKYPKPKKKSSPDGSADPIPTNA